MFQWPLPWKIRLKGPADTPMVDNIEEPNQLRESIGDVGYTDSENPMYSDADRTSFAARIRMIFLLGVFCWAVLLAAFAWIFF